MATQKAYRLHSYGGPECIQLDDVPVPTPASSEILVAVGAVSLNPIDWKIREGHVRDVFHIDLPKILGVDFVGTVVALGEGSTSFKIGDRVMAFSDSLEAFAEHIAVPETIVSRVPASLSDIDAASLPIPAVTAWTTLHYAGEVHSGMKILIHGASGVVGAFAVQFAKASGAFVIGTASAKNRGYVMSLGADEFVDYQTEKFEDRAKNIDLVLDYVQIGGSMDTTARSWGTLKPGGAFVTAADPALLGNVPEGFKGFFPRIATNPAALERIAEQVATGHIKSKVARVFPRGELVQAMEMNKSGGVAGRLVVDFKRV
ncbi:hypothetical protein N7448_004430 [Penicillium atrosanguineum]|uniref:Enoyl reductase (ER) domain-containing protein n=1 Tax=Penicillium atrosanguineum TaxID=1132637 RepID=A0A9W9H992_9EURO|nr:uncharacterized protein N7443_003394 [Penicillium atrosanguineum]KAJ5117919.1 hypothetical protein N7526_010942 [Penicillium atrosanguineum]KAJ5141022.1 hypothetical protein N7448_004430 [Penicillium atrosanguineum]KAJ5310933.1 hypothetical protein N7443_003394 [Penicillium atrosanguineum]KAJ5316458.1 hypothetical protein N7476_006765 [Penicillium atrosanguineum]